MRPQTTLTPPTETAEEPNFPSCRYETSMIGAMCRLTVLVGVGRLQSRSTVLGAREAT
jgi:hypothetical protein